MSLIHDTRTDTYFNINNIQFKILLILLCITDAKFGSGKAWPYLIVDHQKRRLVHFLQ